MLLVPCWIQYYYFLGQCHFICCSISFGFTYCEVCNKHASVTITWTYLQHLHLAFPYLHWQIGNGKFLSIHEKKTRYCHISPFQPSPLTSDAFKIHSDCGSVTPAMDCQINNYSGLQPAPSGATSFPAFPGIVLASWPLPGPWCWCLNHDSCTHFWGGTCAMVPVTRTES